MSRCTVTGKPALNPEDASVPNFEKRPDGQYVDHWVLCEEEIARGFVRPLRKTYIHEKCSSITTIPAPIAATYARNPQYYGSTFCCACGDYFLVAEFLWFGTNVRVGS